MSALLAIGGHGTIGSPTPVRAALTEAWYCCAEPGPEQVDLL